MTQIKKKTHNPTLTSFKKSFPRADSGIKPWEKKSLCQLSWRAWTVFCGEEQNTAMGCTLFLFPGGREFQRRSREQQGQPEHRASSERAPLPAMGQLTGPPACASPFSMACTALGQLRPNTASDYLALRPRHRSHLPQALQDASGIPRKEPVPFPHSSGAELLTEQTLVVTSCIFPVLYCSTTMSLPPGRCVLPSEGEAIPPSRSGLCCPRLEGGEAMPKAAVLKLSQGEIALPRL